MLKLQKHIKEFCNLWRGDKFAKNTILNINMGE